MPAGHDNCFDQSDWNEKDKHDNDVLRDARYHDVGEDDHVICLCLTKIQISRAGAGGFYDEVDLTKM